MDPTPTRVSAVHEIGHDAVTLDIRTPPGFEARPGQFVKLVVEVDGESRSRFYTVSSPDTTDSFEITVAVEPGGEVGPYLANLDSGAEVTIAGPFGNAYYEDESMTTILASGPGVGPAIGIAERTLADGGHTAVVYQDDEPLHRDRLHELTDRGVTVELVAADESLTRPVERALANEDDEQVFVYGFAPFLDAATTALDAAGGDSTAAKLESFG